MRKVNVDWLGSCPRCGCNHAIVETDMGNEFMLYEDDLLHCQDCRLSGIVEVTDDYADDRAAYASWSEFKEAGSRNE
ncbi:hypothetical protein [Acinetobacter colistiniresistens]|uniref:hypothetical protein n=1 Tax=Acinetobacter colistiniresistens TaxID=280145 RepID=UPI0012500996|nr:hypothetical protein [Acinetobacter colistiniresistens]